MPTHGELSEPHRRHRWRRRSRRALLVLGVIVVVLLIIRLALPSIVRRNINARLERIPEYTGSVENVDLAIWRGAYALHHLVILKRDGASKDPYFRVVEIDFSIAWRELLHGRLVSDIQLDQPELTLIKAPSKEATQVAVDRRWQEAVHDIFPIDITLLKITDGQLRYVNDTTNPKVDLRIAHMRVLATGLKNRSADVNDEFPAHVTVEGETIGGGVLKISAQGEPLADQPHFLVKAEVEKVSLPALNEFLRAYAGVDVSKGIFSLYVEAVARNGHYEGYLKPFFDQVDFSQQPGEKEPVTQQVRELFVRMFTWVFKNHPRDEVATKIPFEGEFKEINYSTWVTFVNMMKHAFVQPLQKKLDSQAPGGQGAKGDVKK